jgi:hypothetical protein
MVDNENRVSFTERAFESDPHHYTEQRFDFTLADGETK